MSGVYIFSENLALAAEIVSFAQSTGTTVSLVTISSRDIEKLQLFPIDKIFVLEGESILPENYWKSIGELLRIEKASVFLVGATTSGRDLAARVAGYLDCPMLSDVAEISYQDGMVTATRLLYGGLVQQSQSVEGTCVATILPGKFEPFDSAGTPAVEVRRVEADDRLTIVETAPIVRQGVNLVAAEKVICVGMGLQKEEDLQLIRDLAGALGAEIGCTRPIAEERHWVPSEQYIGISGTVIKPKLHLSIGASGQAQHTFGIRDARIIVAVDKNPKAPIFKIADYGIVDDLYQVIPLLTAALRELSE